MTTTVQLGTTTEVDAQVIWKIIDGLKPSDKAKITKGDNKLRQIMAERNSFVQERVRTVLNRYAPIRDAKMEDAKAKRDAIMAQAQAEYVETCKEAQAECNVFLNPVHEAYNREWKINYDLYREEWIQLVREVSGQEIG